MAPHTNPLAAATPSGATSGASASDRRVCSIDSLVYEYEKALAPTTSVKIR
jgi:hypothetical protein